MVEEIFKRRSIRKYTDKIIEQEKIELLLRAAMQAPSGMNFQCLEYLVINDREKLDEISTMSLNSVHTKVAPLAICVLANTQLCAKQNYWFQQDASAATQNILLTCTSLGLGACWLGFYPEKERCDRFKSYFNLESKYEIISVISIGYPIVDKEPIDRYDEFKIHYNEIK